MSDKTHSFDPQVAMRELVDFSSKFASGIPALQAASGVEIGCSDKEAVFRDDKITLYRYKPIAKPAGVTPLLISYALVAALHGVRALEPTCRPLSRSSSSPGTLRQPGTL